MVTTINSHPGNEEPASYANSAYYGIHTFKIINRDDRVTFVRWRFMPQDGEEPASDADLKSKPAQGLEQALVKRTRQGVVRWDMLLTIREPGDSKDDPTISWPANREGLHIGTLTISSATPQKGVGCAKIDHDTLAMADGIAPRDSALLFDSPSYGLSTFVPTR